MSFPDIDAGLARQGRALFSWYPVAFACGALVYLTARVELPLWPVGVLVLLGGAGLFFVTGRPALRFVLLILLMSGAGFLDAGWQTLRQAPMPALPVRATVITGQVEALETLPPRGDEGDGGRRIVLSGAVFDTPVDRGMVPLRRTLRIRLRDDDPAQPVPGQTVQVRAMVRGPEAPSFPGGRDFQRESWFSGSAGSGRALGRVVLTQVERSSLGLEILRERIAGKIETLLPGQTGAIAATLLVGESGRIDGTTRQEFSASGLAHLLAVAGLHLGLVMGIVAVVVRSGLALSERLALFWPCREVAAVSGLVVGGVYVLMTGAHLPSVRALGMAVLLTVALVLGRRVVSMRSLAVVGLLVLVVSPVSVLDVSFQMSFAAVMGLIAGYEALREPLLKLRGEGGFFRGVLSHLAALSLTSLLAGLATLPISMAHFGAFQPWFVLANLVAVPLAAFWIMPMGLLALVLMPFQASAGPLRVMGWGIEVVRAMAHGVARFPAAHVPVPAMPGWGLLAVLLGLSVLCLLRGRWRLGGLGPIVAGVLSVWCVARPDVLVSADAGLMAVREKGVLAVGAHSGLERMALENWQQALALEIQDLPQECGSGVCRVMVRGQAVLLRVRDRTDGMVLPSVTECAGVQVFVSVSPARGACPGIEVLDRFSVWRDGAYAVFLERGGVRVVSDRAWRGVRVWVPAVGFHGMPNLPLAEAE